MYRIRIRNTPAATLGIGSIPCIDLGSQAEHSLWAKFGQTLLPKIRPNVYIFANSIG
jgi:hypothetical protein